ncbi:MAG: DUF3256 family protein [Prevotella sp.]|jgi:hypothetical protein
MKRLILSVSLLLFTLTISAKSMVEVWETIPDAMLPYIDRNHRLEMTEFLSMGLKGEVNHSLQGQSEMDTITSNYIHLTLNESVEMHIKRLAYNNGDSILCVVKTWSAPDKESEVHFYTQDWQKLDIPNPLEAYKTEFKLIRPDSMSVEKFEALSSKVNFILTGAALSASNDNLQVFQSVPLLSTEDRDKIQPLLMSISLKWDGRTFK